MNPASSTVLGGVVNNGGNLITAMYNNRANQEAATTSWKRQMELWNKTNEYNSASQQVARMREAGLNPNAMFGQMGSATAQSSAAPQQAPSQMQFTPLDSSLGLMQTQNSLLQSQVQTNQQNMQVLQQSCDKISTEVEALRENIKAMKSDNQWRDLNNARNYYLQGLEAEIKKGSLRSIDLDNLFSTITLTDRALGVTWQNDYLRSMTGYNSINAQWLPYQRETERKMAKASQTSANAQWLTAKTNQKLANEGQIPLLKQQTNVAYQENYRRNLENNLFQSFIAGTYKVNGMSMTGSEMYVRNQWIQPFQSGQQSINWTPVLNNMQVTTGYVNCLTNAVSGFIPTNIPTKTKK